MQRFKEPHATREPQFGHPCYITWLKFFKYSTGASQLQSIQNEV